MPESHPTHFYFVRHGETDWNLKSIIMGQKDIPLNRKGLDQAESASSHFKGLSIGTICSSPLKRSLQTAVIINRQLNCPLIEIEELREFNLGPHESNLFGSWFEEWRQGKNLEGAESYQNFLKRARIGIQKALTYPGPVLIVAHGGIYWSIRQDFDLPNCIPIYHKVKNGIIQVL